MCATVLKSLKYVISRCHVRNRLYSWQWHY